MRCCSALSCRMKVNLKAQLRLSDGKLYDDSPWTDKEMDLLAAEVDAMFDDDMEGRKLSFVRLSSARMTWGKDQSNRRTLNHDQ